jgi:hypothetical protein
MATCQNGWPANDRSLIASYSIPGGRIALHRGSAGSVLAWCLIEWNRTVEPLLWPGCWGYAERPIRGSTTELSNHAGGVAADSCAPRHPLGTDPAANFSPRQIVAVHALLGRCVLRGKRLIRWGGDYVGRKDGMHLEVNDGVTEAELDELWAALKRGAAPAAPILPAAPPGGAGGLRTLSYGMRADRGVAAWQRWSNAYDWRPALPVLPVTGNYLDQTKAVVAAAQRQAGVTGPDADGTTIGPRSKAAFYARGARW